MPLLLILLLGAISPEDGRRIDWFTAADYPSAALRAGIEGTVEAVVEIDATGMPTSCSVRVSSGNADLDTTTCRLFMERGRFYPARDNTGRAVASQFVKRIVWRLPKRNVNPVPNSGK